MQRNEHIHTGINVDPNQYEFLPASAVQVPDHHETGYPSLLIPASLCVLYMYIKRASKCWKLFENGSQVWITFCAATPQLVCIMHLSVVLPCPLRHIVNHLIPDESYVLPDCSAVPELCHLHFHDLKPLLVVLSYVMWMHMSYHATTLCIPRYPCIRSVSQSASWFSPWDFWLSQTANCRMFSLNQQHSHTG